MKVKVTTSTTAFGVVQGCAFALLLLLATVTLDAQTPGRLTDDQLIANANNSYSAGDYLQASVLYFAYMERSPDALNTSGGFKQDVLVAYWYSRGQVTDSINQMYQLRAQLAQLQSSNNNKSGEGSTSSGLGGQRPKPKPPVPIAPQTGKMKPS